MSWQVAIGSLYVAPTQWSPLRCSALTTPSNHPAHSPVSVCFPRKHKSSPENKRKNVNHRDNFQAMAVRATVSRFPIDSDAQESSGLPWGVTVTPFAAKDEEGRPPAYGTDGHLLPRCENCWAYFNNFCDLDQWSWTCCLCSQLNGLSAKAIAKYSHPQSCAEMTSSFVDLELPGQNNLNFSNTF